MCLRIFARGFLHFFIVFGLAKLKPGQTVTGPEKVGVVVDDSGHRHAAAQVDDVRLSASVLVEVLALSQVKDFAVADGD